MTNHGTESPPDFDEEFTQAIAQWRERHKLREDDAILLLVELFRIHQKHWDSLRSREMPAYNQFRSDIGQLVQASKTFQQDAGTLITLLKNQTTTGNSTKISHTAAVIAAVACLVAGYLIKTIWP